MKSTTTKTIRFAHTITAGGLVDWLGGVPFHAEVSVHVDQPINGTPLDPGGTVTMKATWD